ncbi:hypothetical protein BSP38_034 [Bacillus phage BSP38]|uniref:Right handed beta helix domain-containing protein n=1 Tax=Bacillus phage BSP38 TaxID=2283013 RepID=A0A345MJP4_BPBSP|nr:tail spike protein [Bacillus phage BSP38]AXH71076.1 hypothetical protein BSP38_034 [Bacillus phage BSP38]
MENSKYVYFVDFEKFGIKSDGTDAAATTSGWIAALKEAVDLGYPKVYVPAGLYLIDAVGKTDSLPEYGGGLRFPSNIEVIFHEMALFKVEPNSSTGYACFNLENVENVTLRGGYVIGDRYEHDYTLDGVPNNRRTHEWGHCLHIRGCRNIYVENMTLMNATGDNIWVPAKGMMNWEGSTYIPSEGITIHKCTTIRGRRNNFATNGCIGLNIDDCDFIEAGGDVIGPAFGIDLEGFAENSIKYDHPYEINITNCRFKRNGKGALNINVTGKVHATNNFTDDVISYGFSTDGTISNNTITNETGVHKPFGIDSIRKSSSETGNRTIITGNQIRGFASGICARGVGVIVSNNYLSDISSVGIYPYLSEEVLVSNNIINSDCLHVWVRESKDVKVNNTKGKGAANNYGIKVEASHDVVLNDNEHEAKGGIQIARSTNVRVKDNDLNLIGNGNGISWDKTSQVKILDGNWINGAVAIAISGYGEVYPTNIMRNTIEDCKYLIGIYLNGGSQHVIKDNDIMFRRGSNGGYGVQLKDTTDVRVYRNDVRTMDGGTLYSSFDSSGALSTKYVGNTMDAGGINKNDTDYVDSSNVVFPKQA